jgi:hypothetical protein
MSPEGDRHSRQVMVAPFVLAAPIGEPTGLMRTQKPPEEYSRQKCSLSPFSRQQK